jgi:hypothetical protein
MILHKSSPGAFEDGPFNLSNSGSLMSDAGVRFAPHQIIIQNRGESTVRVGDGDAIGATTGYELLPGGEFNAHLPHHDELYLYGTTTNADDICITVIVD